MALYTPRGLKLRLPRDYAFALMARVFPKVDAFRMLQLTEEIENMPACASYIAAIFAFVCLTSPLQIGFVVFLSSVLFQVVLLFGLFIPPFTILMPISRLYSVLTGYGVLLVILIVVGFVMTGWTGVLAYFIAKVAAMIVAVTTEFLWSDAAFKKLKFTITFSERNFFHAYRLCANRYGLSTALEVSDQELDSSSWEAVYCDLALKWPIVVSRFTDD